LAKVTVYVDDEVWFRFRASVFHKHGSLKSLNREVESSLRSALVDGEVLPYLEKITVSLNPKTRARPRLRGPPAEAQVRRMRRSRYEAVS
jgi:hypothetical protein